MRFTSLLVVALAAACSNAPKQNKPIEIKELGVTIDAAAATVQPHSASIVIWTPESGLANGEILDLSAMPDVTLEPPPGSEVVSDTKSGDRRLLEYRFQGGRYFRMFENVGPRKLACVTSILGGVTGGQGDEARRRDYELGKTACLTMRASAAAERSASR
jgi:hypothetical protein